MLFWLMGIEVQVLVRMCWFTINRCFEFFVGKSFHLNIEKREQIINFFFNGELNMSVDAINMAMKVFNMILCNYNKRVVYVPSPHFDGISKSSDSLLFDFFHN